MRFSGWNPPEAKKIAEAAQTKALVTFLAKYPKADNTKFERGKFQGGQHRNSGNFFIKNDGYGTLQKRPQFSQQILEPGNEKTPGAGFICRRFFTTAETKWVEGLKFANPHSPFSRLRPEFKRTFQQTHQHFRH